MMIEFFHLITGIQLSVKLQLLKQNYTYDKRLAAWHTDLYGFT